MSGLVDTPGPWDVFPNPDTGRVTIGPVESHSNLVREVATAYYDRPLDANVLAAAPTLAEALVDLVDQIEGLGIEDWSGAEGLSLVSAREAIALARRIEP